MQRTPSSMISSSTTTTVLFPVRIFLNCAFNVVSNIEIGSAARRRLLVNLFTSKN